MPAYIVLYYNIKKCTSLFAHSHVFLFFFFPFVFFLFFINKMAAALLWDSKHNFSSGTCRSLATVWGRFHGDCDCCNGHQHWLAGNLWSGKGIDGGCLGLKGNLLLREVFKNCKLVVFWMTLLIAATRKGLTSGKSTRIAEGKCIGTKHTSTKSKCRQITSPGSVFF